MPVTPCFPPPLRAPIGWATIAGQRVPIEIDERTWGVWFRTVLDLIETLEGTSITDLAGVALTAAQKLDLTDGGETVLHTHQHNNTTARQGGSATEAYHFTSAQHAYLDNHESDADPHSQYVLEEQVVLENGFEHSGTDSGTTLSFVDGTRTFTITPTGASFTFFCAGQKFVKTTPQSIVINDVEGLHHIYFDTSGNLAILEGAFDVTVLLVTNTFVSSLYWNATDNARIYLADERHGRVMDSDSHRYLHLSEGTRWISGLALNNITADGSGDLAIHAQFGVGDGVIRDEDISLSITGGSPQTLTNPAQIPIYYLSGATPVFRKITATTFPVTTTGTGRMAYNLLSAGSWSLAEVSNNDFALVHYFATNDIEEPIKAIIGQSIYTTIANARDGALVELTNLQLSFLGGIVNEIKPIGTVIYQTSNAYLNAVKSRVRTVTGGGSYIDWRFSNRVPVTGIGTAITDHGALTGLLDDDHTQYTLRSEEDAASGYAGLNASSRVTKGVDTTDDLIVDLTTKGLVLKDNAGTPHYWRVTVTAAGALVTTDVGAVKP